jgi:hypothetical protein
MGGSVNFVFRDSGGTVNFREIYTRGMYFIQASPEVVHHHTSPMHYCDEWYGKESILDQKDGISPGGYGLLVIDYMKNEMYTIQGYCHIGEVLTYIKSPAHHCGLDDEIANVHCLIKAGRVKEVSKGYGESKKKIRNTKKNPITIEAVENFSLELINFSLDTSPLKVKQFQESRQGYSALKKRMVAAGFKIDEANWTGFVKDQFDGY